MKIYFEVTTKRREKELLENGNEVSKQCVLDVDFKIIRNSIKELILRHSVLTDRGLIVGYFKKLNATTLREVHERDMIELDALCFVELIECLKGFDKEKAKIDKQEEEDFAKKIDDFVKGKYYRINFDGYTKNHLNRFLGSFHPDFEEKYKNYPKVIAKKRELEQIKRQQDEQDRIEEEQNRIKKEEIKASVIERKEILRKWAVKNGSKLLRLRIINEQNWVNLADMEYISSIIPKEWVLDELQEEESWNVMNANLEQLKALEKVKKDYLDAKIQRFRFCNTEGDVYHKTFIQNDFTSLSGRKISALFEIKDIED